MQIFMYFGCYLKILNNSPWCKVCIELAKFWPLNGWNPDAKAAECWWWWWWWCGWWWCDDTRWSYCNDSLVLVGTTPTMEPVLGGRGPTPAEDAAGVYCGGMLVRAPNGDAMLGIPPLLCFRRRARRLLNQTWMFANQKNMDLISRKRDI